MSYLECKTSKAETCYVLYKFTGGRAQCLSEQQRVCEVPSTGGRSSTVSFKLLPRLYTRTVCHSLSFRVWPANIVSGPLPAGQSKQRLTHMHINTQTHTHNREAERERGDINRKEDSVNELSSLTETENIKVNIVNGAEKHIILTYICCTAPLDRASNLPIPTEHCFHHTTRREAVIRVTLLLLPTLTVLL